jgi:nucleotide-binding universal stress UspA family protein
MKVRYALRVNPREAPRRLPRNRAIDGPALVVVGIDGSATAWRAFAWACGHARRERCDVLCVYVSTNRSWISLVPAGDAAALVADSAEYAAEDIRGELMRTARSFDVAARFEHRCGDPAQELIRVAQEHGADLMIIGASAQPLHKVAGSLASRLLRCRHIPVVVVP